MASSNHEVFIFIINSSAVFSMLANLDMLISFHCVMPTLGFDLTKTTGCWVRIKLHISKYLAKSLVTHHKHSLHAEFCKFLSIYILSSLFSMLNDQIFVGGPPLCKDIIHYSSMLLIFCRFICGSIREASYPEKQRKNSYRS